MFCKWVVLLAASLPIAFASDIRIVEEIVAKVNGDIITKGEIDRTRQTLDTELRRQGLSGAKLTAALKEYEANALRDQIDQLLLVQKAKDLDINVDSDVTRQMAQIQVQSKISDPDKFREYVRQQAGMTYEDYKDQMRKQLLTQRVIGQEVSSKIAIPEADKHKYYDEHKSDFVRKEEVFLSQILISTEGKTPAQVAAAEKEAKDIVARARSGDKFTDLVRQYSDDTETARNGGQLPPSTRGMLRPEIENIVFKQKKGYVTDPIQVPGGLLILKIDDHYDAGQASFEEVENQITEILATPKMEPKVREYLTKLRQDAFLQIKAGYVDSGAAPGKDTSWKDAQELKPQTVTKEEVQAQHKKKLLWVIPYGKSTPAPSAPAPAPAPAKQ